MRRTYKSKKDAPGAMDPRDMYPIDSKASVFDAFYIQNLKQTKREMSVGSTFQFAASNKVRKRKYVKRLKEQDTFRESTSKSAFLTPDKSFRVNKAPDLFDQLLNSSPAVISPSLKKELPHPQQVKLERRTCYKKKKTKSKNINYSSSDSSDSVKENTSSKNITKNSSDIESHELIIEKKNNAKVIDQSINNIFNNLLLFNHQHKNENSPIDSLNIVSCKIENSPLCSTPLNEKYRSKSIYKYSPIAISLEDSPKCLTMDKNNDCNSKTELKMTDYDLSTNARKSIILQHIPKHINTRKFRTKNETIKDIPENNSTFHTKEESLISLSINTTKVSPNKVTVNDSKCDAYNYVSLRDSTLEEPPKALLDISDSSQNSKLMQATNIIKRNNTFNESLNYSLEDFPSKPFLGFTHVETENNISTNSEVSRKNSTQSLTDDIDIESLYDTCDSDEQDEKLDIKEPLVVIDRLNDSTCLKNDFSYSNIDSSNIVESDSLNYSNNYISIEESDNSISHRSNSMLLETLKTDQLQNERVLNNEALLTESKLAENYDDLFKTVDGLSFVTTRRRNEITNDSFIVSADNSFHNFNDSFDNLMCRPSSVIVRELDAVQDNLQNDTLVSEESDVENEPNVTTIGSCVNVSTEKQIKDDRKKDYVGELEKLSPKTIENIQHTTKNISNKHFTTLIENKHSKSLENNKHSRSSAAKNTQMTNRRLTEKLLDNTNQYDLNRKSICSTSDNLDRAGEPKHMIMLKPGKKWERSLSIYRRMTTMTDHFDSSILDEEHLENKGRKYRQSVISTMEMQDFLGSDHNVSINSRRSTFVSKPIRSTIRIIKDLNTSNVSVYSTISDETQGFLTEDCDDTVIELSKLSIADYEPEVTILEKFHDTSNRRLAARDYVLRRCNQSDAILFDECYPDTVLKNCRKIGEGVYGEVFLWRAGDGRARVLKIIPIAGSIKVNGEDQKDYDEIISEIVIAMELSALRTPIPEIEKHLDEGKSIETLDLHSIENATDIFNEVLAVRCVFGPYPARLLDLWELYDESRGSENDSPAALPPSQHFLVLELANAGQDLEGFHFTNAEQAYSVFCQVAFGLAVGEEAFQFEHRDLHWGNVLISPTDQKCASFVVGGRLHRVARRGVAATIIDYSLSRVSLGGRGAAGGRGSLGGRAQLYNDLGADEALFEAAGDYQFEVYRLMREKLANEWKNFEPYTNVLWLHYTADKMVTALRYSRTGSKLHKHYVAKLRALGPRLLTFASARQLVLAALL